MMFYMATGSRKTDIMAAIILYMFRAWGYQCFLFTTNTTAVVDKTIDNLVNSASAKYLYNNPLVIDGDHVTI
ncbi:DEAD/DEAH box helicase family protein, partial [Acinetobacter baumannii]